LIIIVRAIKAGLRAPKCSNEFGFAACMTTSIFSSLESYEDYNDREKSEEPDHRTSDDWDVGTVIMRPKSMIVLWKEKSSITLRTFLSCW
jgi:hypothetical protein